MLGIFQMNFKVLQFTIWEKLPSTHINFTIFCRLKIITQSKGFVWREKIYFSADAIRGSEKVYEGLKGTKITKDISEKNYVGKRQSKLVSLQGQSRYERVSTGQFWHFIWGKGLARESLQGCGMTSMPIFLVWSKHPMPSMPELRGRSWPSRNLLPLLSLLIFCPLQ